MRSLQQTVKSAADVDKSRWQPNCIDFYDVMICDHPVNGFVAIPKGFQPLNRKILNREQRG